MGNLYKHPPSYHLTNIIVFVTDIGITPILLPLQHSSSEPMVIGKMHILHIYA